MTFPKAYANMSRQTFTTWCCPFDRSLSAWLLVSLFLVH